VIGAVALGLLLVVSLALTGVFSTPGSGPGGTNGIPSSGAWAIGAAAEPAGTWTPILALGYALATSETVISNLSEYRALGCSVSVLVGTSDLNPTVPAFTGNLSSGNANLWFLEYTNATLGAVFAVAVLDGTTALAFEFSGGECATLAGEADSVAGTVSSATAASALVPEGLGAYLAAHPTGVSLGMTDLAFDLGRGVTTEWLFQYEPCSIDVNGGTTSTPPDSPPAFGGTVNGTTGAVASAGEADAACPGTAGTGSSPLGTAFALGNPDAYVGPGHDRSLAEQGCASGDACVQIEIEAATNVTPEDFLLYVADPNGTAADTSIAGYAILNATGHVITYSVGPYENLTWHGSAAVLGAPITSLDTITVDCGPTALPAGAPYVLVAAGTGPYTGEIGLDLP